ncbi:hypothetical protein [Nocardioides sp. T2.26MG-1]|uniref:hypothetical protein n=1 Tax=Nocardioides sp. T2.26MG-1 TaxID=3041166 RepID=UPI002477ADF0|nr:hypothetical protein [Nocardioides sp. T2.26MG-1]CAI9408338.1 hypothetical protein HIDPHFAB_01058 [Nocardioides sp. T2.26MG-1]
MTSTLPGAEANAQHALVLQKRDRLLAGGLYEERDGILIGPRCPQAVASVISLGRPVMMSARQSGRRSTGVTDNVARDAYEAADVLFAELDIYVAHLLPTYDHLASLIMRSTNVVQAVELETGKPFTCAFARYDLRSHGQALFITLTAGSAAKIDSRRQSPVIVNLADDVAECEPSVLCGKRADRIRRTGWEQAPMWTQFAALVKRGVTVTVVDGKTGVWRDDDFAQAQHLVDGKKDRQVALTLFTTTRTTMLSRMARANNTDTGAIRMVDGYLPFALPSATPPGLTRIELVSEPVTGVTKRLYLDSPKHYPSPAFIKSGLPIVRDDRGKPADQVKNIRWYLKNAGKPNWTVGELGREMVRRGYSTDEIRWRRGPAGRWTEEQNYDLQVAIWSNLDFYETGSFQRTILDKTLTFVDVWPSPGKRWATQEDFDRIRAWRAGETQRVSQQAGSTFVSLRVEYNGEVRRLEPVTVSSVGEPGSSTVKYLLEKDRVASRAGDVGSEDAVGVVEGTPSSRPVVWLEHEWIADAILQALRRAQRAPAARVVAEEMDEQLAKLRAAVAAAAGRVRTATEEMARIEHDNDELVPGTSEHVIPADMRATKWRRHADLSGALPQLEAAVLQAELAYEHHRVRLAEIQRGMEVAAIADVLVSLLDPRDTTYRALWRATIHNLKVVCTRRRQFSLHGRLVEFSFDIHVSDGDVTVAVPASGRRMLGRAATADQLADELLEDLREGQPLEPYECGLRRAAMFTLRERLRCTDGRGSFLKCRQPDLLKLGMAVLFPSDGPDVTAAGDSETNLAASLALVLRGDPALISVFTHPEVLAERMLRLYGELHPGQKHWAHPVGRVHAQAVHGASERAGRVTAADLGSRRLRELARSLRRGPWAAEWAQEGSDLVLRPCPSCGSRRRAVLILREVDGYVCCSCRADSSGVTWPTDLFGAYVVDETGLAPANGESRRPVASVDKKDDGARRTPCVSRARTLSEPEVVELVRAYCEEQLSMRELAARFGLNRKDVSALLHRQGVVRHSGRSRAVRVGDATEE